MDPNFEKCLKNGGLTNFETDGAIIQKELDAATLDLEGAHKSLSEPDSKWATIKAYYSMFHAAKGLLYSKGYREKSHNCLAVAIKGLFVDEGAMDAKHYTRLKDCKHLREEADYGMVFSSESAAEAIQWADEFLQATKGLIGKHSQSKSAP